MERLAEEFSGKYDGWEALTTLEEDSGLKAVSLDSAVTR